MILIPPKIKLNQKHSMLLASEYNLTTIKDKCALKGSELGKVSFHGEVKRMFRTRDHH